MSEQLNGKEYIRKLKIIAHLNIGIPLLFFIYVYLESTAEKLYPLISEEFKMTVFIPVSLIGLALIIIGHKKYNQNISAAGEKEKLSEKLNCYKKGTTIRFISYSVSALFISIGFYLTDFQPFAALFGIMIVLFSINNPTARKAAIDLKLKDNDKEILLKGLDLPNN